MLLSVIVPVYNAGEFLKPCIESLLALPMEKEIIVVDDGSTDGAVERLSVIDYRLSIIRQTNQGVSAARNAGLKQARGEWVWFVDADDVVDANVNANPNVNLNANPNVNLLLLPYDWTERGESERFEAQAGEIPYNLWRCWFRRDWIEKYGIRFSNGRKYAEDQEFILNYLLNTSEETKALDGPVYHYTMRASGAMMRKDVCWKKRWDLWCVLWGFVARSIASGKISQQWVRKQIRRITKNLIII